jgi:hypothetical protein
MLRIFTMVFKCFSGVFASVSDVCFKYFIYFWTYIVNIASGCFKTRSSVASPSVPFLLSHLGVRRGKAETVPTSASRPHMLAGGRSRRDVDGRTQQARQGNGVDVRTGASVRTSDCWPHPIYLVYQSKVPAYLVSIWTYC